MLPLDDRGYERWPDPRPAVGPQGDAYEYLPDTQPIFGRAAVDTLNRDFDIDASVAPAPGGVTEGVILAQGNRFGGYTLFVKDGRVHFVYNLCGVREYRVTAPFPATDEERAVSVAFRMTGVSEAKADLTVGAAPPVTGLIDATDPLRLPRPLQRKLRPRPRAVGMRRLRRALHLHRPDRQGEGEPRGAATHRSLEGAGRGPGGAVTTAAA